MTKADIVEAVCEKVGFSRKDAAEMVDLVFDSIKQTLETHGKVKIHGFGNFIVRQKKARVGRNPHTGEPIEISARRVPLFRPSQLLKEALKARAEASQTESSADSGKPDPEAEPGSK